jgi:hypothetical protein
MLVFLTLLLALNGGAFGASSFHAMPGLAATATGPATLMPNDGVSGPPDSVIPIPAAPAPTSSGTVSFKGGAPVRYDGVSGPPDHL